MVWTCVDSALRELPLLRSIAFLNLGIKEQLKKLELELRFLKMFFWCFATWNDESLNRSAVAHIEVALEEAGRRLYDVRELYASRSLRLYSETLIWDENGSVYLYLERMVWDEMSSVCSELLEIFLQLKQEIEDICLDLLAASLQCKFSETSQLLEFLDYIMTNLIDLVGSRTGLIDPLKEQIRALEEKLRLFRRIVSFTAVRCANVGEIRDFGVHVQTWANGAACLLFLYWTYGKEEEMAAKMDLLLFDALQRIRPCTPEVTRMYFGVLKSSKLLPSDTLPVGEILEEFVDFVFQNTAIPEEDVAKNLREELMFSIAFLMDPPEEIVEDTKLTQIQKQIDGALDDAVSLICSSYSLDKIREGFTEDGKSILHSFLGKIDVIKAEVKEVCVSRVSSNFPGTNGLGFIDFFLGNLENLKELLESDPDESTDTELITFKEQVFVIEEAIKSLRPFLKDILEMKNEDDGLKGLQRQIVNITYQADHAINSSLTVNGPIWYIMISLPHVIEQINLVKTKVDEIRGKEVQSMEVLNSDTSPNHFLPVQAQTPDSEKDEVMVGLKDEAEAIINLLTGGSSELDIVSVVGMAGLGKTTLAKKVYKDPSVRSHFNKCAFCCVSQAYGTRKLLFDILSDLVVADEEICSMGEQDLAERLYKCLKGQRYLIVMDDIWDIKMWDEIKISFPNDDNGSRVMFTTRIHKVALEAKSDCTIFPLRLLSDEESWELLQKKIFTEDDCPPSLAVVGEQIARNCKGLPLAVVVIGGVLARTRKSVGWWKEISDTMATYLSSEGCMEILELSYKHLPEPLKSCFLYFGAFVEDKEIRVSKLASLWIAEGIVQKSKMKSSKDVAKEYLNDLISRSLVIAARHSSDGWIKSCRVHDLLRDLCLRKAKEENFLKQVNRNDISAESSPSVRYDQGRLSVQTEWSSFVRSNPRWSCIRTLCYSSNSNYTGNWHPDDVTSFFKRFSLVQVLDLEDVIISENLPTEITSLVLLRYLAVKGNIQEVASSIENLWNLQTFIVKRRTELPIRLPKSIWEVKKLRHVDVGYATIPLGQNDSRLEDMETFSSLELSYGEGNGEEGKELLRRIPNVRKLSCQYLDSWDSSNIRNRLPELDILSKLESLNAIYHGQRLQPYACKFPSTLKKLTLSEFRFPWSDMSTMIVKLPNLEVLKLLSAAFQGGTWNLEEDDEFLKLKYLEFRELDLIEWNAYTDSFPCLERLVVIDCYQLQEIPLSFAEVSTLKAIEVRGCKTRVEKSAIQIQEQQIDLGNEGFQLLI